MWEESWLSKLNILSIIQAVCVWVHKRKVEKKVVNMWTPELSQIWFGSTWSVWKSKKPDCETWWWWRTIQEQQQATEHTLRQSHRWLGGKGGAIPPLKEGKVVSIIKLCHAQFAIYAALDWKNRWLSASDVAQRLSVETVFFQWLIRLCEEQLWSNRRNISQWTRRQSLWILAI